MSESCCVNTERGNFSIGQYEKYAGIFSKVPWKSQVQFKVSKQWFELKFNPGSLSSCEHVVKSKIDYKRKGCLIWSQCFGNKENKVENSEYRIFISRYQPKSWIMPRIVYTADMQCYPYLIRSICIDDVVDWNSFNLQHPSTFTKTSRYSTRHGWSKASRIFRGQATKQRATCAEPGG